MTRRGRSNAASTPSRRGRLSHAARAGRPVRPLRHLPRAGRRRSRPFYDSLVGKLIVYAATREEALRKMRAALCELVIDGVETNIAEQLRIISDPRFSSGRI